jgi:acetyl esterase/lipase
VLGALLAVLAGVIAGLVVYDTSLQPGAALVAGVFNKNALVTPPRGFGAAADPALARAMGLTAAVPPGGLRAVVLFCGLYDLRTVSGTGFPALRTYLWAYTGVRDWTSYPAIDQLSTTRHITPRYPPTFLSVGDADPFRTQATELASALRRHAVPLTTVFWAGTGDHLGHEYQFNFDLPQARTAFRRVLGFLAGTGG